MDYSIAREIATSMQGFQNRSIVISSRDIPTEFAAATSLLHAIDAIDYSFALDIPTLNMPRPGLIVTPFVSNLITGTTFPNLPTADELESVKGILLAKQTIVNEELERARRVHFKKRRIDDEDGSGGRSGSVPRSADLDRARVDGFAKKASPAKVKRERNSGESSVFNHFYGAIIPHLNTSSDGARLHLYETILIVASPAPSNASSVAFRPPQPPANVVTYGQAQKLKLKKKHKLQDSDDERGQ